MNAMHRWIPLFAFLSLACSEYEIGGQKPVDPGDSDPPEAGAAVLEVDPLTVDFDALAPGEEASSSVSVANTGDADMVIHSLELSDATGAFSTTELGTPALAPGDSTSFVVTYQPSEPGSFDAQVLVTSDAPADGEATVILLGETLWPDLSISPESHDFGDLEVDSVDYLDVEVSNAGDSPAALTGIRFTSSSETELLVHDQGDLAALPLTLDPGDSASLQLRFAPSDEGSEEASLVVETEDPSNPELLCQVVGNGLAPEVFEYEIKLSLTADDAYQAWIDGAEVTGSSSSTWSSDDSATAILESGGHAIAVYATDQHAVIAGFIAAVEVDGSAWSYTGDGSWLHSATSPASGWEDPAFDDSAWTTPHTCADSSPWGSSPADLLAAGAKWVWWTTDCRALGEAWFRLNLALP